MERHRIINEHGWLNIHYSGEAMDDGCANEISLYESEFDGRLQLLLTNVDFSGKSKENTFSLTKSDAMEMAEFLMKWAKNG